MGKVYEGSMVGTGLKIGIVAARWNEFMGGKLLEGARDVLIRHGVDEKAIDVARVPGSYELPLIGKKMAETGRYDAVICLGVLIRGGTSHYDLIASQMTRGIGSASMETGVPIAFGVITADTIEQAIERAGCKAGNKGVEAALAAIETANLLKAIGE